MEIVTLPELIDLYREEIIRRCGATSAPKGTAHWRNGGLGAILDQLIIELRDVPARTEAVDRVAMSGSEVTQPDGGIGRSIVDLALELNVPMAADDFLMLDRCLDAATAHAIVQYVKGIASDRAVNPLQDLTDTAISAFEVLQTGTVGVTGKTGTLVHRSLMDIRALSEEAA